MSTIAGIVRAGKGRAGHGDSWHCRRLGWPDIENGYAYQLTHYRHVMLKWSKTEDGKIELLDYDTGHGSASDQHGVNKALKALGIYNLYYSRAGGAHYV